MNSNIKYILILSLSLFSFLILNTDARATTDSVQVNLTVAGTCNSNTICEVGLGEDTNSCPSDCVTVTPPVVPAPNGGTSGGRSGASQSSVILSVTSVVPEQNKITVNWQSSVPVTAQITWTINSIYGSYVLQEYGLKTLHSFVMNNLAPQARYTITITAKDSIGRVISQQFFAETLPVAVVTPTIKNFKINNQSTGISLTWDNPDEPFDHVRVLRSDTFFPTNPWDGELVYEGNAEMLTDTNILDTKRYYYTIFTKDDTGFSYGVSQSFQKGNDTTNNDTIGYPIGVFGPISDGSYIEALSESPFQIHVSQEGEDVKVVDDVYYIKAGSYILIQIPKTRKIPNDAQFFVVYVDKNNSAVQENYVLDFDSENQNYTTSFFPAQDGVSKNFIVYMKTRDGIVGYYGSILIDQNEQDRTTFFERILIEIFKILALIYAFFQKILSSILSLI